MIGVVSPLSLSCSGCNVYVYCVVYCVILMLLFWIFCLYFLCGFFLFNVAVEASRQKAEITRHAGIRRVVSNMLRLTEARGKQGKYIWDFWSGRLLLTATLKGSLRRCRALSDITLSHNCIFWQILLSEEFNNRLKTHFAAQKHHRGNVV